LVPAPFSKRVEKEYCVSFRTPLAVETAPFPSFKPPAQWALAVRTMSLISCGITSGFRELHAPEPAHIQCTTPDRLAARGPAPTRRRVPEPACQARAEMCG